MYVVDYYIVFAIVLAKRNESTMVNSKKKLDVVLFFYIAMHDPTIYLIWSNRGVFIVNI